MFEYLQFLIPLLLLWYGWKYSRNTPRYMDERGGFPTARAKESEEMWINVHRIAGRACFVLAAVLAVVAVVCTLVFAESTAAYWIQIVIEIVGLVALVPAVNAITERKYPEK